MNRDFSVLISVYKESNTNQFIQAMSSVFDQSLKPKEVVLVEDGPLTKNLYKEIYEMKKNHPSLKVIKLKENKGLGRALAEGIKHCSCEFVARMDTDDISRFDRFEKQVDYLAKNKNVSVVGGQIAEFYTSKEEIENYRIVPLEYNEIKNMITIRNPMNHVTVMFRKNDIISVGSYRHMNYLEDYYLWVRLVAQNKILKNIDDVLVDVRTGKEMYARRGNKMYIKSWRNLQKYMYENRLINKYQYYINNLNILIFINIPPKIKEFIYSKFLRKSKKD